MCPWALCNQLARRKHSFFFCIDVCAPSAGYKTKMVRFHKNYGPIQQRFLLSRLRFKKSLAGNSSMSDLPMYDLVCLMVEVMCKQHCSVQIYAQRVRHAHLSMMTRREEKGKVTTDSRHPVRNLNDSLLRNLRPTIAQERPIRKKKIDLFVSKLERWHCQQDKNFDFGHPPFAFFINGNNADQATRVFPHMSKMIGDKVKDSNAIAIQTKSGETLCKSHSFMKRK